MGLEAFTSADGSFMDIEIERLLDRLRRCDRLCNRGTQHIDTLAIEGADGLKEDAIGEGTLDLFSEDMIGHDV